MKKSKTQQKVDRVTNEIVTILSPLDIEARRRVIAAACILLDIPIPKPLSKPEGKVTTA